MRGFVRLSSGHIAVVGGLLMLVGLGDQSLAQAPRCASPRRETN